MRQRNTSSNFNESNFGTSFDLNRRRIESDNDYMTPFDIKEISSIEVSSYDRTEDVFYFF